MNSSVAKYLSVLTVSIAFLAGLFFNTTSAGAFVADKQEACRIRASAICEYRRVQSLRNGPCLETEKTVKPYQPELLCEDGKMPTLTEISPSTATDSNQPAPSSSESSGKPWGTWLVLLGLVGIVVTGLLYYRKGQPERRRIIAKNTFAAFLALILSAQLATRVMAWLLGNIGAHDLPAPGLFSIPATLGIFVFTFPALAVALTWVMKALGRN